MTPDADLAAIGAALGEPARARILLALGDGRALPATVLAAEAGVAASTASAHLARLLDAGLLSVLSQGRHRYYRLAGPDVGALLEACARVAPATTVRSLRQGTRAEALRRARTCYGPPRRAPRRRPVPRAHRSRRRHRRRRPAPRRRGHDRPALRTRLRARLPAHRGRRRAPRKARRRRPTPISGPALLRRLDRAGAPPVRRRRARAARCAARARVGAARRPSPLRIRYPGGRARAAPGAGAAAVTSATTSSRSSTHVIPSTSKASILPP